MARTLRSRCPGCAAPCFGTEGLRRSLCAQCGHERLQPITRGEPLVDFRCLACGTVMERALWPGALSCPHCQLGFLPATVDPPARYLVRERVGRQEAGALLSQARFGDLGELRLVFAPTWVYRAAEIAWLIGNERENPAGGSVRRRSRNRDAPAPTMGAPRGGALAYSKHDFGRSLRELLVDPATEQLGWKPFAQHMDATTLAPLESAELGTVSRVLVPELDAAEALARCRSKVAASALVPERAFYKFFERRELIRELLVLVYHPYWLASEGDAPVLLDAVAGARIDPPNAEDIELHFEPEAEICTVASSSLVCVGCGGSPGEVAAGTTTLRCQACGQVQALEPSGPVAVEATFVRPRKDLEEVEGDDASASMHLPVWRYPVTVTSEDEGTFISTRADWKRFLKQVEVDPSPEDDESPVYFYVVASGPALTPRLDSLSLALTRVQPDLEVVDAPAPAESEVLGGRYEAEAAQRMAFAIYVGELKDLGLKAIDRLKRVRVEAGAPELLYLPCQAGRTEIHDRVIGVALQVAPLR